MTATVETDRNRMVRRIATAGAVWAVAKILDIPRVARATKKVDKRMEQSAVRAAKSLRRAGSNARKNTGLLIAGVAALALAAGLLGRASIR